MSSSNQNITNSTSETISGRDTAAPPVVCQSSYKAAATVLQQQRYESAVMSQQYGVYLESCSRMSACADDTNSYVDVVDDDYGYVDCAANELHSADVSFSFQITNDQNAARENYVSNPYYVKVLSE